MKKQTLWAILFLALLISACSQEDEQPTDLLETSQTPLSAMESDLEATKQFVAKFPEVSEEEMAEAGKQNNPLYLWFADFEDASFIGDLEFLGRNSFQETGTLLRGRVRLLTTGVLTFRGVRRGNELFLVFKQRGQEILFTRAEVTDDGAFQGPIIQLNDATVTMGEVISELSEKTANRDSRSDTFDVLGTPYDVLQETVRESENLYSLQLTLAQRIRPLPQGEIITDLSSPLAQRTFDGSIRFSTGRPEGFITSELCAAIDSETIEEVFENGVTSVPGDFRVSLRSELDNQENVLLKVFDPTYLAPTEGEMIFTFQFRPVATAKLLIQGNRIVALFSKNDFPMESEEISYAYIVGNSAAFRNFGTEEEPILFYVGTDVPGTCNSSL